MPDDRFQIIFHRAKIFIRVAQISLIGHQFGAQRIAFQIVSNFLVKCVVDDCQKSLREQCSEPLILAQSSSLSQKLSQSTSIAVYFIVILSIPLLRLNIVVSEETFAGLK